jgi:hypothetical protein
VLTIHFSWELSRLEERTRTLAEEVALLRDDLDRRSAADAARRAGAPANGTTETGDADASSRRG